MNRGDNVYKVVEQEDERQWYVVARTVTVASDKVIFIDAFFPGMAKKNFEARALGTIFFATEQEAVTAFAHQAQRGLESAQRAIVLAERQKNWVAKWVEKSHQNLGSQQCQTTGPDTKQRSLKFASSSKRNAPGSVN